MRKSNIGKIGLIISTILNVILFVLSVIYKTDKVYNIYWISIMLLILFEIYFASFVGTISFFPPFTIKVGTSIFSRSVLSNVFIVLFKFSNISFSFLPG